MRYRNWFQSVVLCLALHVSSIYGAAATATVKLTISSIDAISVSGNPATLTISAATAGSSPTSATNASTTYAVSTNNSSRKIYGSIASAMPTGLTLSIQAAAPSGGTSAGSVAMGTTSQALVSGVSLVASPTLTLTYTLAATAGAAQVTGATNTVTYTIGP